MTDEFAGVLAHYPQPLRELNWVRLDVSGGLSGATIWRGEHGSVPLFGAKRYPAYCDSSHVVRGHRWIREAGRAGLAFVPNIVPNSDGTTVAEHRERVWEIQGWMPGEADFCAKPSRIKFDNACDGILRLLEVWRGLGTRIETGRAVLSRLELLGKWQSDPPTSSTPISIRATAAIARYIDRAKSRLLPWADRPLPSQPCVRDLRADHFLFSGDKLTGLIDFGAADWDTPATDAARMLGELAGDDPTLYGLGIERFSCGLGLEIDGPELIRALDLAGTIGSVIHWMYRFQKPHLIPVSLRVAEARIVRLLRRLESDFFH